MKTAVEFGYVHNDGGRLAAGFRGTTRDCVCRAIAIVTGTPYLEVYEALNELGQLERITERRRNRSSNRAGIHKGTTRKYLASLGFVWVPTMTIGSGCTVHLRADQLPAGRILVQVTKHITAVIDGVIHDTHNPSREGARCVYGYWTRSAEADRVATEQRSAYDTVVERYPEANWVTGKRRAGWSTLWIEVEGVKLSSEFDYKGGYDRPRAERAAWEHAFRCLPLFPELQKAS